MSDTKRVGHYRLLEPIGTGGFATVYRAVDERLDSEVAIKVLAENHALDPDIRERFITEAQLLRRVASPSVIEIHDIGETASNQPFIVMTYADRGDLRLRVEELRNGDVTVDCRDVLTVARTLTTGLEAVHRAGLVHRDVKPDNLLISSSGGADDDGRLLEPGERLRLGDLGYAKDLAASSGLTVGGGTQGFNAPEQRVGLTTVSLQADIFGASAVVFWLLAGVTPPATTREQRRLLVSQAVDQAIIDTLVIGLAEDPQDRFESITDWNAALKPSPLHEAPEPTPRRRAWPAVALTACIGLGVGAGSTLVWAADDGPRSATVEDGITRVEDRRGSLRVGVFGPRTAQVGTPITFSAAIDGAVSYSWIAPDGSTSNGTPTLQVTVDQPGTSHLTLLGRDSTGSTLAVDF
ncbi:MAG: protein kinase, partial [Acidimicrobiales bacterium]